MIWAGSPFAQLIEFSTGLPTGAISYELFGHDGTSLDDGTVTPSVGQLSHLLVIPGSFNTCANPLFESRVLTWHYTTATGLVSDRIIYRVNAPVPVPASPEGVRSKLGIEAHELPDDQIDLVGAYARLTALLTEDAVTTAATAGDLASLLCVDAVEALAALDVLPTLQVRIAQRETDGTNQYSRFAKIDWDMLAVRLAKYVDEARSVIDGTFDLFGSDQFVFEALPRTTDAYTGS